MNKTFRYPSFLKMNVLLSVGTFTIFLGLLFLPINTVNIDVTDTKEVVACLNDESCIQACQQEKQRSDFLFEKLHPGR